MTVVTKWLLRLALLFTAVVILAAGGLWWCVSTENGTRWLFDRIVAFAPPGLAVKNVSGTLRHTVGIGRIDFVQPERRIELSGTRLQIDWHNTSPAGIALERLSIDEVVIQTGEQVTQTPGEFPTDIPGLPIDISASFLDIGVVDVDGRVISEIEVRDQAINGQQLTVSSVVAIFEPVEIRFNDVELLLSDDLPVNLSVAWKTTDDRWSGDGAVSGSVRFPELQHQLYGDYQVSTSGSLDLSRTGEPAFDLVSRFDEIRYEQWVATDGNVSLTGTIDAYRSDVSISIAGDELLSAQVNGGVEGNQEQLHFIDLAVTSDAGRVHIGGDAQWLPETAADLVVTGSAIDLSPLTGDYSSTVDMDIRLVGDDLDSFTVQFRRVTGIYNEQSVEASGSIIRDGDSWRCTSCDANVGENHLQAELTVTNRRLDGTIDFELPSMHQLHPDIAGTMQASGSLSGQLDRPILAGQLEAENLKFREFSLAALEIDSPAITEESVDISMSAESLAVGGNDYGGGVVNVTGQFDEVAIDSRWTIDEFDVHVVAELEYSDDLIFGLLTIAEFSEPYTGEWRLDSPAALSLAAENISIEEAIISNGDARVEIGHLSSAEGNIAVAIELVKAPLQWLDKLTPDEVAFEGYVDAVLDLQQSVEGWSGSMDWRQSQTVVRVDPTTEDGFSIAVPVATASARLDATGASIQANVKADTGIEAGLQASTTGLDPDASFEASLMAKGNDWAWLSAFVPEAEEIVGVLEADLRASGKLYEPQMGGEVRFSDGKLALPALNVPLTDINLQVTGSSADRLELSGEARTGEGSLAVLGTISDLIAGSPRLELQFEGQDAKVLDWPDYELVASPKLTLSGINQEYHVDGSVRLERANILVRELPEGTVRPSDDVTVIGREPAAPQLTRLTGNIEIQLGDAVHVRAFGLDTNLEGDLRMRLPDGRQPEANGELTLDGGFFEMYGTRLEIEYGTVLFSGALDNPFVDARVVRELDYRGESIRVGLDLQGRAQNLRSAIFSEPAMSEADALSFIVSGRPLSAARDEDSDMLGDAAFSLGLRQAAVIANQVGQMVGLDELSFAGSSQDTTELIAGKQVSSDLYARYRYGVFSNLGELLLRYSLTDSFSVEFGVGEFQSIDLQYTIERE